MKALHLFPRSRMLLGVVIAVGLAGCGSQCPLVFRFDGIVNSKTFGLYLTNTGDAPLHAITFQCDQAGESTSKIAIDTIQPHQTVHLGPEAMSALFEDLKLKEKLPRTISVTCHGHKRPLRISELSW